MRNYILPILMLLSFTATAQNLIPFATGRSTDTASTPGSILVPKYVRFPNYSSSDTNKVLGVGSNGMLILRTKGNGTGSGADSSTFATNYRVDTAKTALRASIAAKIPYTDTTTKIVTFKQLKDSLNNMTLDRAAINGNVAQRDVYVADAPLVSATSIVGMFHNTPYIYGAQGGESKWNFASTGSGSGTYGYMQLYRNVSGTVRHVDLIPASLSASRTATLQDASGTLAFTSDTANCVQKADSNVARGWMSYSYWLANRTTGTVTSITASSPLTGGTITTSGSIGLGTVGYANGGTNATSFTSQRLIFSGVNTLKAHDSMAVDTAAANGYIGLGTTTPTTPLHIKRNKATNMISEFTGAQSGISVAGLQFKNPSGSTFEVGIKDNAPTGVFKIGSTEYATFNNAGFNFGTIAGGVGNQSFFSFAGNAGNSSGLCRGMYLNFAGTSSSTAAFNGFVMNVSTTLSGSGAHLLMDIQRSTVSKFKIDTGGQTSLPYLIGNGTAPTIAAGAGAGTGATVAISGCDGWGNITITTGTGTSSSATVATITFNLPKSAAPKFVSIHPADQNAAELTGNGNVYADIASATTTTWTIKSSSVGLASSTTYTFTYQIAQ